MTVLVQYVGKDKDGNVRVEYKKERTRQDLGTAYGSNNSKAGGRRTKRSTKTDENIGESES